MTGTTIAYLALDSTLSSRKRADRVLSACFEGQVNEARQMLSGDADADGLLARGVVTYWLARVGSEYTYEAAKDLLSQASRLFLERGDVERSHLTDIWLGLCYWLQGQFPEAFILLNKSAESCDPNVRFMALVNISVLQTEYSRWSFSLATLATAQPLFDLQENYSWRGKFFQQRGLSYKQAYEETRDKNYLDRALTDYEAASDHYETAGNSRSEAAIMNNVANLYRVDGQLQRARNSADRAITLYERLGDRSHLAHAKDTKALILLDSGEPMRAKKYAEQSIALLRKFDPAWVTIPLVTLARINFALGLTTVARKGFEEAICIAEGSGNPKRAAEIYLDLAETMAGSLSIEAVARVFSRIEELAPNRVISIAHRVLESASTPEVHSLHDLKTAKKKDEHEIILRALESEKGSVTRAAKKLGKTHGGLTHIIKTRHPDLQQRCRPVVHRHKSTVKELAR